MLLNYHIGCIVLGLPCVGSGCGSARVVSGLPAAALLQPAARNMLSI